MTNEEIERLRARAEDEYDRLKDMVVELQIDKKELQEKVADLEYEIVKLKQAKEDTERYYQDNWRPIPTSTYYGIRERDFY